MDQKLFDFIENEDRKQDHFYSLENNNGFNDEKIVFDDDKQDLFAYTDLIN